MLCHIIFARTAGPSCLRSRARHDTRSSQRPRSQSATAPCGAPDTRSSPVSTALAQPASPHVVTSLVYSRSNFKQSGSRACPYSTASFADELRIALADAIELEARPAGTPLLAPLTIMGWPVVELWVASSDTDADLFAYLEDYDPKADKARYAVVTSDVKLF